MPDVLSDLCCGRVSPSSENVRAAEERVASGCVDSDSAQQLLNWTTERVEVGDHASLRLLLACPPSALRRCSLPLGLAQRLLSDAGLSNVEVTADKEEEEDERLRLSLAAIAALVSRVESAPAAFCDLGVLEGVVDRIRTFREPGISWEAKVADIDILDRVLRCQPSLSPKVYRDLDGFVYLVEVLDLVLGANSEGSRCSPTPQAQRLLCLAMRVLTAMAGANDRDNLGSDEEAHYLRLVSLLHDLLLLLPQEEARRRQLVDACLDLLATVPLVAFEELTTPAAAEMEEEEETQQTADCVRFDGKNLSAVSCLVEHLRHCLREAPDDPPVATCLLVLTEASVSQRSVRRFLRSQILPSRRGVGQEEPELYEEESLSSATETDSAILLSDLCRLVKCAPASQQALRAAQLLYVLCKERAAKVVRHTGLSHFPSLVHSLQLPPSRHSMSDAYSSDSSEEEALDPDVVDDGPEVAAVEADVCD